MPQDGKIGTGKQRRAMKKTVSDINRKKSRSAGLAPSYGLNSTSTIKSRMKPAGSKKERKLKGTWKIKRKFTK